jgi:hypothetical protein
MKATLIAATIFGILWVSENVQMPAWVGVVTLGVMLTGLIALAVKWVRNA